MIARNKVALSATFALSLVIAQFGVIQLSPGALPVRIALPVTIAAAPLALWLYRGRAGVWIVFVGLAANLCVIVANGGLMPMERRTLVSAVGVDRADGYVAGQWISGSKDVLVERPDGRLVALGDSIILRFGGGGFVASPGDVVIWSGLIILVGEASLAWQSTERAKRTERAQRIAQAQLALHTGDEASTAEGGAATQR